LTALPIDGGAVCLRGQIFWGISRMSARQLFRKEAIDFYRGQRDFGEITLLQPVSTKLLAWLLAGGW
jgi:hypothetical protein